VLRRLSGWQRIGVVLSVLWCAWSVLSYMMQYAAGRASSASLDQEICLYDKQRNPALDCSDAWSKSFNEFAALNWNDLLLTTLVPVLLAWLAAWIIFLTFRWVRTGFKPQT
jgi:hypothetical protein